ncbi:hypothetical protein AK812_SmicGene37253 [Symbiodinium microadriaticum]|uniref:Uncharacterized protein n=1 Tax=Symbiodinium microadriaticum TaxID=2951 RepID=A0A1Q9CGS3_SYMMI|nr:hypothetical protein AK812_SmicGene37253 [Symbiodinium microadriaticum]
MLFRVFVSCGKNLRSTPPSETPLEIPSEDIAQTMEAAAAATSACVNLQDDEEMDVMTTAEPEMEVDDSLTEADPDAEDLQDQHQEEVMSRMFDGGSRYDVLGLWPTLNGIDEQTMISREAKAVNPPKIVNVTSGNVIESAELCCPSALGAFPAELSFQSRVCTDQYKHRQ